ncbi:relaxase/mobilization nuclease domain-containing protein [Oceanisphaera ostreae]|uniref:Relaxase/mobilization nuclease domain-containing protein n=1 Tax=Oceanisphaera ostreae TaxID=914151 RepID=A0ABW3KEB0_9GAMM
MILEIKKNKNKKGNRGHAPHLVNYICGNTKDHSAALDKELEFIAANGFDLLDPTGYGAVSLRKADLSQHIKQFNERIELNTAVDNPLKHFIISLAEGEKLTSGEWFDVVNEFMTEMGYENCLYIATKHSDTDKEHVHITACTIKDEYRSPVVNQWQEKVRGMELMRSFEIKYGLQKVEGPEDGLNINNADKQPSKAAIRHIIDLVLHENKNQTLPELIKNLNNYGVGVSIQFKSGKAVGLSFSFKELSCSGSKLGGAGRYALPGLIKMGINYDNERDHKELESLKIEEEKRRDGSSPPLIAKEKRASEFNNAQKSLRKSKQDQGRAISFYLIAHINKDKMVHVKKLRNKPRFIRHNKKSAKLYFPISKNDGVDIEMMEGILALINLILSLLFGSVNLTIVKPELDLSNKDYNTFKLGRSKPLVINKEYKSNIENYFEEIEKDKNKYKKLLIEHRLST